MNGTEPLKVKHHSLTGRITLTKVMGRPDHWEFQPSAIA